MDAQTTPRPGRWLWLATVSLATAGFIAMGVRPVHAQEAPAGPRQKTESPYFFVKTAASMLYHHLLHAGVRIYEYCDRPLHGKVALMDGKWSTVGSSNLDPLSLSLNLEANVVVRDEAFNSVLAERLDKLMQCSCKQVEAADLASEWSGWRLVRSFFVFHILRWYPALLGRLPRHVPRLTPAEATDLASRRDTGLSNPTGGATQTEAA